MGGSRHPSEPLVTVIIPTYGRSEALKEALSSVLDQTYENLELVVVDDASPVPVEPLVEDVSADTTDRVTCLRHDENKGANAARNTGIRAANGDFLAFLDDDDRWLPESVERRVMAFEGRPDVGVVYSQALTVDEEGRVLHETSGSVSGEALRPLLRGAIVGSFSRVMVRAAVVDRAGLPDERFPSWQDWEWYIRLAQHCLFEQVPDSLVVRQLSHEQISDSHETKRDVSYPLLLDKHRETSAEFGWLVERQFRGACARSLAASALRNGYWFDSIRYALKAVQAYPFSRSSLLYLGLALGGPRALEPARALRRALAN